MSLLSDPNWWQARLAEDPCPDSGKLIPSRELEEKRKAFVPPESDYTTKIGLCGSLVSRKKKKELFKSKQVGTLFSETGRGYLCYLDNLCNGWDVLHERDH